MASDCNVIQKSGAWFSVDGERIGQGRDNARTYLEQHPELLEKIEQKVLAANGINRQGAGAPPAPASGAQEGSKPGKGEPEPARAAPQNGAARPHSSQAIRATASVYRP